MRDIGHFIGGKRVKGASGRQGDVFDPNTGEVQAKVALASKSEVEAAIANAEAAQPANLPDCLPRLLQLLAEGDSDAIDLWENHHKEFACVLSPQTTQRIGTALQNFDFDAAQALLAELPA